MPKRTFVDFRAVKDAVSIAQILDHYGLTASFKASANGENLSGPCPLHGGDNPTQFRVSLPKNCWHCFSECQHGGNILDFVSVKEDCTIRQAAILISEWFNLPLDGSLKSSTSSNRREEEEATASKEAPSAEAVQQKHRHGGNAESEKHVVQEPEDSPPNKPLGFALKHLDPAHPYLAKRGLSEETIAHFGLGFCAKGSMTGRIAIPIHNVEGQLVAYAGRWPGEVSLDKEFDTPKYRFPAGFRKSLELFHLHGALQEPAARPLVLVEGFFGCMHLWQLGIRRVVALMGSSLSCAQEELIIRHTDSVSHVVVMLDEDPAGRAGRENIVQRLSMKLFVRVFSFQKEGGQPEHLTDEDLIGLYD